MKNLIVIADYSGDSLACQEIKTSIEGNLKDSTSSNISFVSSSPSTINTAFLLYQLVRIEKRFGTPQETVFFVNTDPRLEKSSGKDMSMGAQGLIIKLSSGIYLIGPNAGYCFSLIKEDIDVIYSYSPLNKKGQFRSRDNYARIIAHLMDYLEHDLELEAISERTVPTLHGFYVGHIDNYGNIKTTITHEDLKGKFEYDDYVTVMINNISHKCRYVPHLFAGKVSELVIYPGSSGRRDEPFLEISAWSHFGIDENNSSLETGKYFFKGIKPGDKINIC